jgi:3-oxoacyl-(acyl-carrier-protein) synthase
MSRVFVHGLGAVSPAGWGVAALRDVLERGVPLPTGPLARPGWEKPLHVRPVPPPAQRPAGLAHPRLRRTSLITQHAVAAALEAMGGDAATFQAGEQRLGIVVGVMSGCVAYSRRFYEEVLHDPSTASPLVFPETVFNAPGSHLAAYLNATGVSYTLVGDDAAFVQGLAIGAGWLARGEVDGCLVVGAEESDWLIADALRQFDRSAIQGAGAGALYLRAEPSSLGVELDMITDAFSFSSIRARKAAAQSVRAQLGDEGTRGLLCLATLGRPAQDAAELEAWRDWVGARIAPKQCLGEAFTAAAAWQCVTACDALRSGKQETAVVSATGVLGQAMGVRFRRAN